MFSGTVSIFFIVILTFCAELCLIMPYLVIVGKRSVGILLSDVSLTLLANYVCLVTYTMVPISQNVANVSTYWKCDLIQ
jgi:hypothetical protein